MVKTYCRFAFTWLLLAFVDANALRAAPDKPALVVVISIDQFRYDYLQRFRAFFGPGGFNLLLSRGADFQDCHFEHSHTKTGPGHAVMLTGVHANLHGIIANDWIDRQSFERVSCVGDRDVQIVGLPASTPHVRGFEDPYLGRSPRNLLVSTVGDELKLARGGKPKVIGISNKDRAAILMSGKMADAAYFMQDGQMVSSTYYFRELPGWVRAWNSAKKADAYFGKTWERVLPEAAYACQGPDDMAGEDKTAAHLGNTLPKLITGGETSPGPKFYDAFENSPFSNDVLADFAKMVVEEEKLGARAGVTDLLCLSFSANDHIGHLYGPDSHEVMDNVVRMDRTLADFFAALDRQVGLKRCTIVLTADHGVPSTPEYIHSLNTNVPAGRIDGVALLAAGEAALNRQFGPLADNSRWLVRDDGNLLIHSSALAEKKIASGDAQNVVRDALRKLDFVQAAYTRAQLENGDVHDELGRAALLSFNRERSGDLYFQAKPNYFSRPVGANHGSPYNYDTHVPLVWFGVGVKPGVYRQRVSMADLAPTLANLLEVPAPPLANGRILF